MIEPPPVPLPHNCEWEDRALKLGFENARLKKEIAEHDAHRANWERLNAGLSEKLEEAERLAERERESANAVISAARRLWEKSQAELKEVASAQAVAAAGAMLKGHTAADYVPEPRYPHHGTGRGPM